MATQEPTTLSTDHDQAFPLMRLPAELRLMVYERIGPTYQPLPLRAGHRENLFFHDFGLQLLQTSKLIATEAESTLQLPHPTLSLRSGGSQFTVLRHFNTVRIIYRLLRCLEEGSLCKAIQDLIHSKEDFPKLGSSMLPKQPLRANTNTSPSIPSCKTLKAWFRCSVEHLRKDPTVVIRILLEIDVTANQPSNWMNWYYPVALRTMTDARMWKIKNQVVFVVPPQHADRFRYFMDNEARNYLELEDKYTVQISDELAQNWPEEMYDTKAELSATDEASYSSTPSTRYQ